MSDKPVEKKAPHSPYASKVTMSNCTIEDNGVGMIVGEGYEIAMHDTNVVGNRIGVVAGSLDDNCLQVLKESNSTERFKFASELNVFDSIEDPQERNAAISKSSLVEKLTAVANAATITTWLEKILSGASNIEYSQLFQLLMGA